ncbi:hydrogenase maturation protease [Chloroflexota bacterium]
MKRIICIGNPYIPEDTAGPKVYKRLLQYTLPNDVEIIDGGLAGLDLLRFVEGAERVVFVDRVSGFGQPNSGKQDANCEIVVLDAANIASVAANRYDHAAGLAYLLHVLPEVCENPVPPTVLVGIEGHPDKRVIDKAAALALEIAVAGSRQNGPVVMNSLEVQ